MAKKHHSVNTSENIDSAEKNNDTRHTYEKRGLPTIVWGGMHGMTCMIIEAYH